MACGKDAEHFDVIDKTFSSTADPISNKCSAVAEMGDRLAA